MPGRCSASKLTQRAFPDRRVIATSMRHRLAFLVASAAIAPAAMAPPPPRLLGIEHVPTAVRNLDIAERRFRALGFTIKPGRPHDNGIANGHAKFADGSYIELITAPADRDALTRTYRRFLAGGEGPAFVSMYVDRIDGLDAALSGFGGRREDGTVVFDRAPLADLFFGTRSRSPTDRPEHYRHANGARGIERVWLAPTDRATVERMTGALGARFATRRQCLPRCGLGREAQLENGALLLLPPSAQIVPGHMIVGVTVTVRDVAVTRAALAAGGIRPGVSGVVERPGSLFVPPALANGLWLEFRAPQAAASSASSP